MVSGCILWLLVNWLVFNFLIMGCVMSVGEFGPPVIGPPVIGPPGNGDFYKKARLDAIECTLSLCEAMETAGGSIVQADFENLSLMDFIMTIAAQNGIRFVCVKPVNKRID